MDKTLIAFLQNPLVFWTILFWSFFWKGLALWKAASKRQLVWFLFLLVFNTVGLLEMIYYLYLNRFDFGSKKLLASLVKIKSSKKII